MLHKEMAMTYVIFSFDFTQILKFRSLFFDTPLYFKALSRTVGFVNGFIFFFKFESELCKIVSYCWKSKTFFKYENIYKNS